jgi:hypothetical protein
MKISSGDLKLSETKFRWKGSKYKILDIKSIYYYQSLTSHNLNGLPLLKIGEASMAILKFKMDSGTKVKIKFDEETWFKGFYKNKQKEIEALQKIYSYVAEKTFKKRAMPYAKQYKENDYFEYDKCRFYPKLKKVIWRNKDFLYDDYEWIRYYGSIKFKKRGMSLLSKLAKEFSLASSPGFSTLTDTDVIFWMIHGTFGLSWKN